MRMLSMLALVLAALVLATLSLTGRALGQHTHPPAHESTSAAAPSEAEVQLATLRAAVARYGDRSAAERDGFRRFERGGGDPLMGQHWFRKDRVDEPFDPARPSTLIYAELGGEHRLVGVAYTVYQRPGEPVPEGFAGDADRWHVHDVADLGRILLADRPVVRWLFERRVARGRIGAGDGRTALAMVHVWLIDNPDGPFANRNPALPYLRFGLPAEWADGEPAARGVALLRPGACAAHVDRIEQLARLERRQVKSLGRACDQAAAAVVEARVSGLPGPALNAVAADAWLGYARALEDALSPEQSRRLAAVRAATTHH